MKTPQQIASESERQIEAIISMRWGETWHEDVHQAVRQVIQAAIEKANTELLRRTFPNQHIGELRAAHASEFVEGEKCPRCLGTGIIGHAAQANDPAKMIERARRN